MCNFKLIKETLSLIPDHQWYHKVVNLVDNSYTMEPSISTTIDKFCGSVYSDDFFHSIPSTSELDACIIICRVLESNKGTLKYRGLKLIEAVERFWASHPDLPKDYFKKIHLKTDALEDPLLDKFINGELN